MRVTGTVTYPIDPIEVLEQLKKPGTRNRIMRKAVRAGVKPVRVAMKAAVPKRSGTLKSSISAKIATSKKKSDEGPPGTVYAVIGPRRKYKKTKQVKTPFGKFERKNITPTQYFRLLEGGAKPHSLAKGGTGKSNHPGFAGRNILRNVFNQQKGAFTAEVLRVAREEVAKELAKLNSKKSKSKPK